MKSKLFFLFLILTQTLTAQTFTEKAGTPFEGVWASSIAFSDINGDGHEDVLITGANSSSERIAKLYTNDGTGIFTEMTGTPFDGVWYGSIAFSDVNADGHVDALITGGKDLLLLEPIAKLYTNDGTGIFTEMPDTPFEGVGGGGIAFSDVNGDGHDDVLITGRNSSEELIAKLYTNDGTGTFTELPGTPFEGVEGKGIAFSDVNGDGYDDVLITGRNSSFNFIAKLYTNDGTGAFTEMPGTPFDGVWYGSIAFSDVNGDGHEDVLIVGGSQFGFSAKLYTNDGTGAFTKKANTPFEGVSVSSIAFSDVNGDGHEDVLITGRNDTLGIESTVKLYTNDGTGTFTEKANTPFESVGLGSIAFSDVNGDGHDDVLITGENSSSGRIAKLYINEGVSSIKDLSTGISLDFILSPNPSPSSTLLLRYNSTEMNALTIKVYDLNGRLLLQQKEYAVNGQQTFSIDITTLTNGNYFLELDNGKRKGVAKLIVQ